ncbi:hypothetical protein DL93DRAFT_1899318 [Clavulina sp. PMI_390]|nr:hypothetical protein DL93DRAFT_1899318 [Clavulina sp. PMI_390]
MSMLAKGGACLPCRRLKLKCNGSRPFCLRCQRSGRGCEYAKGIAKRQPSTRLLEARALELQMTISKLALSSLHDLSLASARLLHRIRRLGTSNSPGLREPAWLPVYPLYDKVRPSGITSKLSGQVIAQDLANGYSPVIQRTVVEHELDTYHWENGGEVPQSLSNNLLFLPYRSKFHFFMDIPSFLHFLSLPGSEPESIHPCLRYACYLAACSVAGGRLALLQPYFLSRTRHFLNQSMMFVDRLPHFLWASMVLACYLGRMRRLEEAFMTISGAIRVAVACGLGPNSRDNDGNDGQPQNNLLPPPKDGFEAQDRARLKHSIYLTDQGQTEVSRFRRTFAYDHQWESAPAAALNQDPHLNVHSLTRTVAGWC